MRFKVSGVIRGHPREKAFLGIARRLTKGAHEPVIDEKFWILTAEVEELRQRSPSFQSELAALREKVEKQEKTISRLRGEQSQLAYAQKQLDAEQQKNRHEVSLTAVQMTVFGQRTEKILRELYENGFNVAEEIQSPPGSIS